ncbi:MAG: RNA polymerase sigma factor [Candidatus Levyibacteriota bacterium]
MASLINKMLAGDPQAIETFYKTYSSGILRYLKHKLPREEDAQEILNDVFLNAVDALPALREETNLKSWLYKIAQHKVVNFYRKRKMKSFLFSQFSYLKLVAEEINEPEFQYEKQELLLKLKQTLQNLSERYQQILRLHYEDAIPIKMIALELNLSPKATESLLYRARQQFKKDYERT